MSNCILDELFSARALTACKCLKEGNYREIEIPSVSDLFVTVLYNEKI